MIGQFSRPYIAKQFAKTRSLSPIFRNVYCSGITATQVLSKNLPWIICDIKSTVLRWKFKTPPCPFVLHCPHHLYQTSFRLFLYITSALLSLQLPCEAREDASNTKVDWWTNSWILRYKQIPTVFPSPLWRGYEELIKHTLEDNKWSKLCRRRKSSEHFFSIANV